MSERLYDTEAGTPASPEAIAAFEAQHGIRFQPDYREFLLSTGSMFISEDFSDYNEANEIDLEWPFEVDRFEGLDVDFSHFFDPAFLRIGYVVGSDGGGNPMIQLTSGRFAGKIAMLDHEVYCGGMEELISIKNGHFPDEPDHTVAFQSFESATDEQIIEECESFGALAVYEMTFSTFMSQLDEYYHAAYHARVKAAGN